MSAETYLNGKVTLRAGDSRDVLKTIADCSIDSIVTDPPYALVSIVKRFGAGNAAAVRVPEGGSGAYARASAGFMGKAWDTGETAFAVEFWAECLRVLKPGGHVVAFSGTRTYHNMTVAIEQAGFEVRDSVIEMLARDAAGLAFLNSLNDEQRSAFIRLMDEQSPTGLLGWCYGSGFPKSHDVAKGLGKQLAGPALCEQWAGWGTALKPAWEPIVIARRPLDRSNTVAANVLQHGTGAINIGACRVGDEVTTTVRNGNSGGNGAYGRDERIFSRENPPGRWPANIIHDGSEEVLAAFPVCDSPRANGNPNERTKGTDGMFRAGDGVSDYRDTGSAARFFYTSKADSDDRLGSKHPTVKPVDLMQWLCRLVTPKGGTVLDPFAGTGTTGEAAFREGFNAVLIEREPEYQADIRRRMALCMSGPEERKRESIKAKIGDVPFEPGSLFAGIEAAAE
ncbi:MAG: site-specific DNA-methyltransferase [Afipia sp.]|nr:site-specific DNA-methyltransferase [Afipia sp.]